MSTFTTIIQHSSGIPSYSNQSRKRNKGNPDQKRRSKALTVCRCHYTVHRKPYLCTCKGTIRKLQELISEFSKVNKINTQKSLAFLYINEKSEREIKKSTPFTISTKRVKYLGINSPKETKELYTEKHCFKALSKNILNLKLTEV